MNKIDTKLNILWLVLLLSGFKIFNTQSLLTSVYIGVTLILIAQYRSVTRPFLLSKTNALLFAFFLCYCSTFFYYDGFQYNILRTAIFSILMYYIGTKIPFVTSSAEKCFQNAIFSIGIGMSMYATLSFFSSYTGRVLSTMNVMDRYVTDFWNGLLIPPTNFNTNFLILFTAVAYVLTQVQSWKKVILLILTGSGVLVAFGTATRTNLFMILLSFMLLFRFDIVYEHKKIERPSGRITPATFAFGVAVIIVSGIVLVKFGDRITDLIENLFASLSYRTSNYVKMSDDPRWKTWINAFVGLIDYPFGNNTSMKIEAHNLILEAGRRTGIIPFVLLLGFVLKVLKNSFMFARNPKIEYQTRLLVFLVTIGTMVAMMIEPVFVGRPYIFIYLSLVWGMTEGTLRMVKTI